MSAYQRPESAEGSVYLGVDFRGPDVLFATRGCQRSAAYFAGFERRRMQVWGVTLGGDMHRIHFSSADLGRVRLMPTLGPMAETLFSLRALRTRADEGVLGGWRRHVRGTLSPQYALLSAISPKREPCLDLVTLAGRSTDLEVGAERLLASTVSAVALELDHFGAHHGRVPGVLHHLADDLSARRELVSTLGDYHRFAIGPRWNRIRSHLDADRVQRGAVLLESGVEGLLSTLHHTITWTNPILRVDSGTAKSHDFHLNGNGLVLMPSFFLRTPLVMFDPASPQELSVVFPARLDVSSAAEIWSVRSPVKGLANLLGRTRASVLLAIADGVATTGELANHTGTSAPAASQHTSVLRAAGLIVTRRHRGTVRHSLTEVGSTLLYRQIG